MRTHRVCRRRRGMTYQKRPAIVFISPQDRSSSRDSSEFRLSVEETRNVRSRAISEQNWTMLSNQFLFLYYDVIVTQIDISLVARSCVNVCSFAKERDSRIGGFCGCAELSLSGASRKTAIIDLTQSLNSPISIENPRLRSTYGNCARFLLRKLRRKIEKDRKIDGEGC